MRFTICITLLTAAFAWAEKPKLVVLDLTPGGGADPQVVSAFTEALTDAVSKAGYFDVVSSRDIAQLLGRERQMQLLGCSEGQCMTELGGAVGARFILSGSLVKLGDAWQLTLTTLDSEKAQPIGRATRIAPALPILHVLLPFSVAEATATPLPAPPSRLLPVTVMAVGAAAIVAGGVLGLQGLSVDATVRGELTGAQLDRMQHYVDQAAQAGALKTASLVTLIGGAALVTLGIVLLPRGPTGPSVALVPTAGGAALAGSFP
jgi:hypothetical protein